MATPVMMPKVGISVESCVITKWHKQKGDAVKKGDILFTYETDKSTLDEEATVEGTLLETFFGDGDDVPCMTNVAVIGNPGESVDEFRPAVEEEEASATAPVAEAPAAAPAPVAAAPAPAKTEGGRLAISPRARLLAAKAGVDATLATPTGAEGRICEADIRTLIANPVAAAPAETVAAVPAAEVSYEDEKLTGIRKSIAKSMVHSLSSMAQLTNNASFDATEIVSFRKKLKANAELMGLGNITLNDIVLYAVSRTLKNHRTLNANMVDDTTLRCFNGVHLGVAVDTDRGLMVPTIFDADKKSLSEISAEVKALAAECQAGSINPDKLRGASFTVSNLGAFGVESFTPVINPPQTGILGVGTITTKVRMKNGELEGYQSMGLSLTYDHRVVDGAPAAKFLQELCRNLENFSLLFVK